MMPNFLVLTGAMGGGKSTVLALLRDAGVACVPEPAREILAEQRRIESPGLPEKDPALFCHLMLSRAIHAYQESQAHTAPVVFDRGIPDMLAYAQLFGLDTHPFLRAAEHYRYHPSVFYFPAWRTIYTNDDERKIDFAGAERFGIQTRTLYESLGYQVIEVPCVSAQERAQFLLQALEERPLC